MKTFWQKGVLTESAAITIFVFMLIALAIAAEVTSQWNYAHQSVYATQAVGAAQAGIDHVILKLNNDENYFNSAGTNSAGVGNSELLNEQTISSSSQFVTTFVIASIVDGSSGGTFAYAPSGSPGLGYEKTVTVQGRVYNATTGKLLSKRDLTVGLEVATQDYPYSVQSGYGDLIMSNSASIDGFVNSAGNGKVYANGDYQINGSTSVNSDELWGADDLCPLVTPFTTFPSVCSSATNKTFQGTSNVTGVSAHNKIHSPYTNNCTGVSNPDVASGLAFSCSTFDNTAPAIALPSEDRNSIKNSITDSSSFATDQSYTGASCVKDWTSNGNVKVTGYLHIFGSTGTTGCTFTFAGNLWITNNLWLQNNSKMILGDVDKNGNPIRSAPVIMIDGSNSNGDGFAMENSSWIQANKYGIMPIIITYYCADASCPDGTPVTTALHTAVSNRTININSSCNASNSGTCQAVLYARWGRVTLQQNAGTTSGQWTGQLAGQSFNIVNAVKIGMQNYTNPTGYAPTLGPNSHKVYKIGAYKESGGGNYSSFSVADNSVADTGRYGSIANGSDGLPVVSYQDATHGYLKVMHCSNASCLVNTTTTVDSSAQVGLETSLAVGTDGFPIITYYDNTNSQQKLVHCTNTTCTSHDTPIVLTAGGRYSSITIGSDNLAVVVLGSSVFKVAHCTNVSCTSFTLSTLAYDSGAVILHTSIGKGGDGFPIFAYGNSTVKLVHCKDVFCNTLDTAITIDAGTDSDMSLEVGSDGFAAISFYNYTAFALHLIHCTNAACSTKDTTRDIDTTGGSYNSIANGSDGFPVITYTDLGPTDLLVAHCANASCSGVVSVKTIDAGIYPGEKDIAIGSDGYPVINYYDNTNGRLKVAKCSSVSCN